MSDGLLIVGVDGLLGRALQQHWVSQGWSVTGTTRRSRVLAAGEIRFDLAASFGQWPTLPVCKVAVLAAGITNGEQCRRDPNGTRQVNVHQTVRLAEQLARRGTLVVFLSTNLVFDGAAPRRRTMETFSPRTEYGRQKAEVEQALAGLGDLGAVVRLTKVFHPSMSLVRGWQADLEQQRPIAPFADLPCAPISLIAAVEAITAIAQRGLSGLWQLSAPSDISYADVARTLARLKNLDDKLIRPVSCHSRGGLEHVPLYTTLDTTRAEQELGFRAEDPVAVVQRVFAA